MRYLSLVRGRPDNDSRREASATDGRLSEWIAAQPIDQYATGSEFHNYCLRSSVVQAVQGLELHYRIRIRP